ncbi:MAG: glycosyltransferase, partial [Clostridia bacterium]|nr:glycosyltransferase [Clostridia bacterium]
MLLQRITFPCAEICNETEMYYRACGAVTGEGDGVVLSDGASVSFDTYFGAFFASKWLEYTPLRRIGLRLDVSGEGSLSLVKTRKVGGETVSETIRTIPLGDESEVRLDDAFGELESEYMYSFALSAQGGDITLRGGEYYCSDDLAGGAWDVRICADICTFRRESYVARNIDILRRYILDNPASPLRGSFGVVVCDNGRTLRDFAPALADTEGVTLLDNANVGGVGGFTRGMMEALSDGSFTYVLLMDDDAVINPYAIERTYAFLRLLLPEYRDMTIGGALLREDAPWLQYESGARWLGGGIDIIHHGMDLREVGDVVASGCEIENADFNGWWYSCIPTENVRCVGLPLPIFIHRDDIEYGLRCKGRFVTLAGVGVWHEAFERKMSGTSEYYDIRNMGIINAIHCQQYGAKHYRKFLRKWVMKNLFSLRYRYIGMNLRGVHDFLRGIDWLKSQEGEALHGEIMAMNYKNVPVASLPGAEDIADIEGRIAEQTEQAFSLAKPARTQRYRKLILSAATVLLGGG